MAAAVQRVAQGIANKAMNTTRSVVVYSQPKLSTFWRYARIELTPPKAAEMPQVSKRMQELVKAFKEKQYRELTVKEAVVNTCITVEVICWFFLGEIIGKRSLVGYQIDGAVHFDPDF